MHTYNETLVRAPADRCFRAAADVERWPEILPHYRYVRFERRDGFGRGRVEMGAYRQFGPLRYPIWWASEMDSDPEAGVIRYRRHAPFHRARLGGAGVALDRRSCRQPGDRASLHPCRGGTDAGRNQTSARGRWRVDASRSRASAA